MGKILVLGRRGQLAREMARLPLNSGVELEFSGRERCDIRDTEGLRRLIDELEPIAVVNTAAYTDVDLAESEEDIVFAVNATAPGAAARECAIRGVPFVHLSSDFVFSGSRDGAYQDDAPTDPINTYGRAKARGEALVQEAAGELGCVLRAAWLHGRYGRNFAATMYRLIGREERIGVVTDQIGNPTRAADAARVSLEVMTLDLAAIQAAAGRLKGHIERTPCRHSRTLSKITGAEVWVKFENLQFTAAYKERGALNKLMLLSDAEKAKGVIAASAGNHAQGLAYHGARLGVPVTIVMPRTTPFVKVQHTRDFGATVVIEGETYDDANAHARKLQRRAGPDLRPPVRRLRHHGRPGHDRPGDAGRRARPGGPARADRRRRPDQRRGHGGQGGQARHPASSAASRPCTRPSPPRCAAWRPIAAGQTIAEGVAVKQVGELTYGVARPLIDDVLLLEEPHIEQAVALYCNVEKTIAEGAGAASLAALLAYPERFRGKKCGLILCGGNIDTRLLASVLTRELVRAQRLVMLRIVGDDRPGLLSTVASVIGDDGRQHHRGGHNRLALDVPAKGAEFDITIETRDAQHTQDVMNALREKGYPPRAV
jgi:threonine dehydratase